MKNKDVNLLSYTKGHYPLADRIIKIYWDKNNPHLIIFLLIILSQLSQQFNSIIQ